MVFKDRHDAGKKLANLLEKYSQASNGVVLGLPRGGVVTGFEVAKSLNLPLDVISPMKIGAPSNPEYAIGAITETGEGIFNIAEVEWLEISKKYLEESVKTAKAEAEKRLKLFRNGRKPLNLEGATAIVVDDGMATGLTMQAAIVSLRQANAKKIIVAVPVAPIDSLMAIKALADEVHCLETPSNFHAVGQFYESFEQVNAPEVIELLKEANHSRMTNSK